MSTPPEDPFAHRPEVDSPPPPQPGEPPVYGQPGPAGHQAQSQAAPGSQPQPSQQYAQPGPGYYGVPPKNPATAKNWMNITALAMSLSALLFGITALGGIIFGHLGRAAARRGEADNGGMGLAGLIIGYVLLVLVILAIVAFIAFFGWIASECSGSNPAAWCDSGVTYEWEALAR